MLNASAHPSARGSRILLRSCVAAAATLCALGAHAQAATYKIGVVTFLSGPAAESYGVPTQKAAQMLIDIFNKGGAPAPYDKKGFGGLTIEMTSVDENGGATKQVQELRNLYQRENVDVAMGYNGSGDCLAIAPVADELKKLLVLYDCGTPRIFEEAKYDYVFRTASHGAQDNVALARYLKARNVKTDTIDMINPDYAYGQDQRSDFIASMEQLKPGAKILADVWPKFGAGQYGSEISAISRQPADIIYSSLWGGDLQAFLLQAGPRGLFKTSKLVVPAADHAFPSLGEKFPDGVVFGSRGAYGVLSKKSPLNDWFQDAYLKYSGSTHVTQGSYRMAQSLMGMKLAVEKAMAANGGKKPSTEQVAAALANSEWEAPGGKVKMALANGHQAIQTIAIGTTKFDPVKKIVGAVDVQYFNAECVNPPANMKSAEWVKAGMPGAKCD
ncbi:MAG: Extracellular ligand-binding receptor [Rhizobacter sp.]|nr:Extracellular ligand-binding receptor [Rhizobacter sp.]